MAKCVMVYTPDGACPGCVKPEMELRLDSKGKPYFYFLECNSLWRSSAGLAGRGMLRLADPDQAPVYKVGAEDTATPAAVSPAPTPKPAPAPKKATVPSFFGLRPS